MALTSVQIREDDWQFCKKQGLKFSELLRSAIEEQKKIVNNITYDNINEERRKKENFIRLAEERLKFIEEKGLLNEFLNKPTEEIKIEKEVVSEEEILEKWRDDNNKEAISEQ